MVVFATRNENVWIQGEQIFPTFISSSPWYNIYIVIFFSKLPRQKRQCTILSAFICRYFPFLPVKYFPVMNRSREWHSLREKNLLIAEVKVIHWWRKSKKQHHYMIQRLFFFCSLNHKQRVGGSCHWQKLKGAFQGTKNSQSKESKNSQKEDNEWIKTFCELLKSCLLMHGFYYNV